MGQSICVDTCTVAAIMSGRARQVIKSDCRMDGFTKGFCYEHKLAIVNLPNIFSSKLLVTRPFATRGTVNNTYPSTLELCIDSGVISRKTACRIGDS